MAEPSAAADRGDPGRIGVDYNGAWNAWGPHDWCDLYNGGGDITDCTVVVELKGAGGQTRKNVHYVPKRPGQSWLYARYEAGTEFNGRQFGRTTVPDVVGERVGACTHSLTVAARRQGATQPRRTAQSRKSA